MDPEVHFTLTIPATIKQCEDLANFLFSEIVRQRGSFEARRIFSQCARPPTKRERQLHENALLVWKYLNMRQKSIRQLAIHLAKENGADPRTIEKKIQRAVKSKRVAEYIFHVLFEITGENKQIIKTGELPWTF